MKNKQKAVLKILLVFMLLAVSGQTQAQADPRLAAADSLFQRKQYTQSLEIYESLFYEKQYSQAMLLRMAFIEEGLGHVGSSLYYLNLYYSHTGDDRALEKIQQVASANRLIGYEHSELRIIQHTINQYQTEINLATASVILFLFVMLVYFKHKTGRKPFGFGFGLIIFCAILFSNVNFNYRPVQGIVKQDRAYLMSGPSAGASVVAIIGEGNMLPIIDKQDVWVQVTWNNKKAYIKESQLHKVQI